MHQGEIKRILENEATKRVAEGDDKVIIVVIRKKYSK